MNRVIVFLFLFVSLSISFAQSKKKDKSKKKGKAEEVEQPKRPIENWVFSANFDGRPNVMIIALHEQLWIAYDRNNCQLIKAWKGGVKIEEGGKNVFSNGLTFYQEDPETKNGWKLNRNGKAETVKTKMGLISMANDSLILNYELRLSDGHVINVQETPEVIVKENNPNRCGLQRDIVVENMPPDSDLFINMKYKDMLRKKDIKSDHKIEVLDHNKKIFDFGTVHDMEVDALLNLEKPTVVKMMFTVDLEKASRTN